MTARSLEPRLASDRLAIMPRTDGRQSHAEIEEEMGLRAMPNAEIRRFYTQRISAMNAQFSDLGNDGINSSKDLVAFIDEFFRDLREMLSQEEWATLRAKYGIAYS